MNIGEYVEAVTKWKEPSGRRIRFLDGSGDPVAELDQTVAVFPFGSRLYGTAGEASDVDLKAVYIAGRADVILERGTGTKRWSTGSDGDGDKNGPDDVDVEAIELRKFIRDALAGQTYAMELLHVDPSDVLYCHDVWEDVLSHKDKLVSQQTKPFMGYCRTQARKYSAKGRRLKTVEEVLKVIENLPTGDRVGDHVEALPLEDDYVKTLEHPIKNQAQPVEMVEVVGKKFELTAPVGKMVTSLRAVHGEYGKRAHAAKDGVDWKAVSHAYRVAWELLELLTEGSLTFPRPRADFLKEVKEGRVPWEQVNEDIPKLADKAMNANSDLPDKPDEVFWKRWLVKTYEKTLYHHSYKAEPWMWPDWPSACDTYFESAEALADACMSYREVDPGRNGGYIPEDGAIVEDAFARLKLSPSELCEKMETPSFTVNYWLDGNWENQQERGDVLSIIRGAAEKHEE